MPNQVQAEKRICQYKHHEEYGQELVCKKCGGKNVVCGPFQHACKDCDPEEFGMCGICRRPRVSCCC